MANGEKANLVRPIKVSFLSPVCRGKALSHGTFWGLHPARPAVWVEPLVTYHQMLCHASRARKERSHPP